MGLGRLLRGGHHWSAAFGFDVRRLLRAFCGLPYVLSDYCELRRQRRRLRSGIKICFSLPCFHDRFQPGGTASGHYFHQDLLVARRVYERKPTKHVDVGSRVDGFAAHVASYRPIEVIDVRPVAAAIPNITFIQHDMMDPSFSLDDYCDSLSCLHALEHFGLGRYGDSVDIRGYLRGLANMTRMLTDGGMMYLSVPIGSERIRFNGERVFSVSTILESTRGSFDLQSFSYVDDVGDLHEDVPLGPDAVSQNFRCERGCGVFELRKRSGN